MDNKEVIKLNDLPDKTKVRIMNMIIEEYNNNNIDHSEFGQNVKQIINTAELYFNNI